MAQWVQETGCPDEAALLERFASMGLDVATLRRVLGEAPERLAERTAVPPRWVTQLLEDWDTTGETMPLGSAQWRPTAPLLVWVQPLMNAALARLTQSLEARFPSMDAGAIASCFAREVPERILWMLSRTAVLELTIARLEQALPGKTPEARFRSFVDRLADRGEGLTILSRYPVLAKRLVETLDQWIAYAVELCERLHTDGEAIRERFDADLQLEYLVAVARLGDRHDNGKTVALLGFEGGGRLIYKPRSLQPDRLFGMLLERLTHLGWDTPFYVPTYLDRTTHGWMSYVEQRDCDNEAQVRAFFRRQGAYVALLYGLEATDFHYENVIAMGEHPVLIDVETLLQPVFTNANPMNPSVGPNTHSVLRCGLLPRRFSGLDLSGLDTPSEQSVPILDVEGANTDEMRFVRKMVKMPTGNNHPTLDGMPQSLWPYREAVSQGFRDMYRFLLVHRDVLMRDGEALARL